MVLELVALRDPVDISGHKVSYLDDAHEIGLYKYMSGFFLVAPEE